MRTRSQMMSPGGFVSLDDHNVARPARQTRSSSQQPTGTQEQPAAQPKTTRAPKKTTTTKTQKATTKSQSRKKTTTRKRTARKNTLQSDQSGSDETEQPQGEENEKAESTASQAEVAPQESGSTEITQEPKEEKNRKRRRPTNEDDDEDINNEAGPITPAANKRRNLGMPGSTPFSYATPLPRRVTANVTPFSERLRRRNAESQGRIYRTSLRVSQYLAQEDADRLASDKLPVPGEDLSTEPFPIFEDNESHQERSSQEHAQQPTTPDRPASGWRIRGLLDSVPRRLSRFIPTFGRTPDRNENQGLAAPSTAPVNRTQPSAPAPMDKTVSPTPASKEPAQERSPDLSYSLFPAPMDWSQYIDDTPPKPKSSLKSALKTTPKAPTAAPESPADTPTPEDSAALRTEASVPRGRSTAQEAASTSTPMRKKRKRAPSPDVIPNPPGCSYGLHPDYFGYNSDIDDEGDDEDEELAPATEPQREDEKGKSAVRSILRSERPLSKRVRFDASPQDTPSKLRMKPRATDPYTGEHFIGMDISPESSNSIPTVAPTPNPQAKQPTVYPDPRSRPGFVPNRDGTFETPYSDTESENSEEADDAPASGFVPNRDGTFETPYSDTSSEASDDEATTPGFVPNRTGTFETPYSDDPSEPSASAPDAVPDAQTAEQTETPSQPDATEITPLEEKQAIVPPSTPAKVEDEALARVRLQAEKYKPKTPSGLRTASRYSTPSTIAATPDAISALVPAPASVPAFAPVPALDFEGASDAEDFGDDQFARDAQWLYENCPTGDLSELVWPDAENYEAMGFSTEAVRIANELWDPSVVDHAYDNIWTPGLEAFRREMETVSSHATLT